MHLNFCKSSTRKFMGSQLFHGELFTNSVWRTEIFIIFQSICFADYTFRSCVTPSSHLRCIRVNVCAPHNNFSYEFPTLRNLFAICLWYMMICLLTKLDNQWLRFISKMCFFFWHKMLRFIQFELKVVKNLYKLIDYLFENLPLYFFPA